MQLQTNVTPENWRDYREKVNYISRSNIEELFEYLFNPSKRVPQTSGKKKQYGFVGGFRERILFTALGLPILDISHSKANWYDVNKDPEIKSEYTFSAANLTGDVLDLFISIHTNEAVRRQLKGVEFDKVLYPFNNSKLFNYTFYYVKGEGDVVKLKKAWLEHMQKPFSNIEAIKDKLMQDIYDYKLCEAYNNLEDQSNTISLYRQRLNATHTRINLLSEINSTDSLDNRKAICERLADYY